MPLTRAQLQQADADNFLDTFDENISAEKLRDGLTRLRANMFNLAEDQLLINQIQGLQTQLNGKEVVGVAATLIESLRASIQSQLDVINNILDVDSDFLDTLQEIKDYIEQNYDLLLSVTVNKLNKSVFEAFVAQYAIDLAGKENVGVAANLVNNVIGGATSAGNTLYKLEQLIASIPVVSEANALKGGHHNYRREKPPTHLQVPGMTLGNSDYDYIQAEINQILHTEGNIVEFLGTETVGYHSRIMGSINTTTGALKKIEVGDYATQFVIRRPTGGYLIFYLSSGYITVNIVQSTFNQLIPASVAAPHVSYFGLSSIQGILVGNKVYVATDQENKMFVFDALTGNYEQSVTINSRFYRPTLHEGLIYGYDYQIPEITVFNPVTKTVIRRINYSPSTIEGFTLNSNRLFVFVSTYTVDHYNYKCLVLDIYNDYAQVNILNEMGAIPYGEINTTDGMAFLLSGTDKMIQFRFQLNTFYTLTVGSGMIDTEEDGSGGTETRKLWKNSDAAWWDVFVTNSKLSSIRKIRNAYATAPIVSAASIFPFAEVDYIGWDQNYAYIFNNAAHKFARYSFEYAYLDEVFPFEGASFYFYVNATTTLISNEAGTIIYNQNSQVFPTRQQLYILEENPIGGNTFKKVWDSKNPPVTQEELEEQLANLPASEVKPFLPSNDTLSISGGRQFVVFNYFRNFGVMNIESGSEFVLASSNGQNVVYQLEGTLILSGTLVL